MTSEDSEGCFWAMDPCHRAVARDLAVLAEVLPRCQFVRSEKVRDWHNETMEAESFSRATQPGQIRQCGSYGNISHVHKAKTDKDVEGKHEI